MSNTFNQSMLMALQRMRRGGQYKSQPVGMVSQQFAPYTPPNNPGDIDYLRQHPEMMQAYDEMYRKIHGNTFTPSGGNSMQSHITMNGFNPDNNPLAGFYQQMQSQYGDSMMTLPESELKSAGRMGNVMGDVNLGNAYDMYRKAKDTRNAQANNLLNSTQEDYKNNAYRFKGVRGAFNNIFARKKLKNLNDRWMGNIQQITDLKQDNSFKKGGSIGTGPYWVPNPGIPTNPRYNQAAINQEAMYEPAPGTIGPPMYPTTPQPYNDGQVGMGVIAPQTPTPTFAPPAPTGPTMAEVSSNYQQPKVNQKDFGKAWNEARNSGLKVFSFRNKMYTTDARTDAGKGAARKAATSMVQSNREYATIADQRMVGFSKNNPYTVTSSSPVTQSQSQTNGNSVPWGKIAGAGVTTAVGMGILGLGTGAIKYPESYMTPKEFIKDAKRNIASKYMTPRELAQSMKKPKYPSNYMTPGEFTKTMTDKLKSMKLPNVSYPKGYMTPKEFAKDVSSKLPKLKKPSISYPQGYMTPKDVKNEMANLKFPKVNVSNIPERIGTRAYQVPTLRSSVKSTDKVYKSMEKTAKRLFKRF